MAKMTLVDMSTALTNKSDELLDKVQEMKKDMNLSENTVRTQTHLKTHEARNLLIMKELVDALSDAGVETVELTGDIAKWFDSTTMLTETRKKGSIILHEGDSVYTIMEEHPNLSLSKIKDLVLKQGFMLDKGVIVR